MRSRTFPFVTFETDGKVTTRPALHVRITNPHTKKSRRYLAIVDTGADECCLPSYVAADLDHNLTDGNIKEDIETVNGITTAYQHTVNFEIVELGFKTADVVVDFFQNLKYVLLGKRSFLSQFRLEVDYLQEKFTLTLPD